MCKLDIGSALKNESDHLSHSDDEILGCVLRVRRKIRDGRYSKVEKYESWHLGEQPDSIELATRWRSIYPSLVARQLHLSRIITLSCCSRYATLCDASRGVAVSVAPVFRSLIGLSVASSNSLADSRLRGTLSVSFSRTSS